MGSVVAVTDTGSLVLPAESVAVHVTVVVPSSITKAVSPTASIGEGSEPLVEAVQSTEILPELTRRRSGLRVPPIGAALLERGVSSERWGHCR